ncbi:MAG TPA: hypothetical protein VGM31_03925, partial [Puia sp.]
MQHPIIPAVLFGLCVVVCILLLLHGLRRSLENSGWDRSRQMRVYRNTALLLVVWIVLLGVLSLRGFFAEFLKLPPRIGMAVMLPLPFVIWIARSKKGTTLLKLLPPHWPIYLQSFRIAVEIALWLSVRDGALPVQLSFEG